MPITVKCPACGAVYVVPDHRAGQVGTCKCCTPLRVPDRPQRSSVSPTLPQPEAPVIGDRLILPRTETPRKPLPSERAKKRSKQQPELTTADNRGIRHDTAQDADAWWTDHMLEGIPALVAEFATEFDARNAMLELEPIHMAADAWQLICTEPLVFGCYRRESGQWEAELAGPALSPDLWEAARSSFLKHGGKLKLARPPRA